MTRNLLLSFILLTLSASSALSTDRKTLIDYAKSLKGLKKEQLKTAVHKLSQPVTLDYGSGKGKTWDGFYSTDRDKQTNECINRYSEKKFYFTTENTFSAITGMNIEHSFPKSWWGKTENDAYKDLFNLYPSDSEANSAKANYPMGKVFNANIHDGYEKVGTGYAGNQTIRLCEPNDEWKGDFSRSYFYMATTYQNLTWQGTEGLQQLENNTWPTLQQWAYTLYLEWGMNDKVSDVEKARNDAVYAIQHNRNLYIDFPTLAEYVWGDSTEVAFNPETALTTADDDTRYADYYPVSGGGTGGDNPSGEGKSLLTEPFDDITSGDNISTGGSSTAWQGNDNFPVVSAAYQAGGALRLGSSKKSGEITSCPITADGGTLTVSLDVKGWTTVEGSLIVSVSGCGSKEISYSAKINEPFEHHTVSFDNVSGSVTLTIATSAKRAFIDNVSITTGATTHISHITSSDAGNVIYNLSGKRLNTLPASSGLYIINGKKKLIKK